MYANEKERHKIFNFLKNYQRTIIDFKPNTGNYPKYPIFSCNKTRHYAYIHKVKITGLKKGMLYLNFQNSTVYIIFSRQKVQWENYQFKWEWA